MPKPQYRIESSGTLKSSLLLPINFKHLYRDSSLAVAVAAKSRTAPEREEIRVVKERDPAIKSSMEVLLYPSFKVILRYRVAHKLYLKKHYFLARWISQRAARKTGIRHDYKNHRNRLISAGYSFYKKGTHGIFG